MRVFDPVVIAQSAGLVPLLALQDLQRGPIGCQPVGDDLIGNEALILEQFLQQFSFAGLRLRAAVLLLSC